MSKTIVNLTFFLGEGGVNNGSREFKIAIDMLNGVNPLKWKTTKEMKGKKGGVGSANQYTCELGIVVGHYPHLAPCLDKFHKLDIYKHMKDYNHMKKNNLLPTEETEPDPKPEPTRGPKPTGPKPTGDKPMPTGPKPTGTNSNIGHRRDPFGNGPPNGMAQNSLFTNDFAEQG